MGSAVGDLQARTASSTVPPTTFLPPKHPYSSLIRRGTAPVGVASKVTNSPTGRPTASISLECESELTFRLTSLAGYVRKYTSPRERATIIAINPKNTLFSQANARDSSPSPLAYSLREECFPELNARLRAEEFGHSSNHILHAAWNEVLAESLFWAKMRIDWQRDYQAA